MSAGEMPIQSRACTKQHVVDDWVQQKVETEMADQVMSGTDNVPQLNTTLQHDHMVAC